MKYNLNCDFLQEMLKPIDKLLGCNWEKGVVVLRSGQLTARRATALVLAPGGAVFLWEC